MRNGITLARIARVVAPLPPHRDPAPAYAIRESLSQMPMAAIDINSRLDALFTLAAFYRERVGWPQQDWLEQRIRDAGAQVGLEVAELFDAWESEPGLRDTLF